MKTTLLKRFAVWSLLLALVVCLPAFAWAADDEPVDVTFQISTNGNYQYVTENVETFELYVEKGAQVTITPVFNTMPSQNSTQSYEWDFYQWDPAEEKGTVCTEKAYTFTFANEGNLNFFANFLDENTQERVYGYNNIYLYDYARITSCSTSYLYNENDSFNVSFSAESVWEQKSREYLCEKFIRDWDNDGRITTAELDENITIDVDSDFQLGSGTAASFADVAEKYDKAGNLEIDLLPMKPEYDGKQVIVKLTNPNNETFSFCFSFKFSGVRIDLLDVAGDVTISENESFINIYGKKGTTITLSDQTTYIGSGNADMEYIWFFWDKATGEETKLPSTARECTYTLVNNGLIYNQINVTVNGDKFTVFNDAAVYIIPGQPEYQIVLEKGIPANAVTSELAAAGLNTPAKIEAEAAANVYAKAVQQLGSISADNVAVYEAQLMYSADGVNWTPITAGNWPEGANKLTVSLPYPKGTSAANNFVVAHMFATSVNGKTPGTFEYPAVRKYAHHFEIEVTGLSPIAIAWSEPAPAVPATGDHAQPLLWLLGAMTAALACALLLGKRRQRN